MLSKYHLQKSDQLFANKFNVSIEKIRKIRQRMGLKKDKYTLETSIYDMEKSRNKRGHEQRRRVESPRTQFKHRQHEERLKKQMFG